jgi:hypothetical protein
MHWDKTFIYLSLSLGVQVDKQMDEHMVERWMGWRVNG